MVVRCYIIRIGFLFLWQTAEIKEISYLIGKSTQKGFSLIPLKIYENNGRIKLEFGLAKGKKKYDKKEKIKKKDIEREVNRELSRE